MEGIVHRTVSVNGINMHIAEKGEGPVVLFLHGFPELWYTWRHQLNAFAALGYRAVAPDLRGFGDTDAPEKVCSYSCLNIVGDIVALIDQWLSGDKVFVVAHDWGAMIGWYLCLFRPDLVKCFVSLTVPFRPRHPKMKPVEGMRAFFGEEYYMCRFQEPGKMESEMARYGAEAVIKKILTDRKPGPPHLPKENPFGSDDINQINLPSWFKEDDLKYYATKYEQKGFTGGLNYYRALDLNWELTAAWTGAKVTVPVKFIVGDVDMVYTTPGVKEYVHGGEFKKDVPLLEECVVLENTGHFINQERPDEINAHIHHFITKF
ncbi:epoxide hydrolase 3 [Henckelia pumila]|uniref:epoxide hydrolase 3 n=1 Tax=Henckelia pumila TaxID=405737 RepID=UPI003C6DEDAF